MLSHSIPQYTTVYHTLTCNAFWLHLHNWHSIIAHHEPLKALINGIRLEEWDSSCFRWHDTFLSPGRTYPYLLLLHFWGSSGKCSIPCKWDSKFLICHASWIHLQLLLTTNNTCTHLHMLAAYPQHCDNNKNMICANLWKIPYLCYESDTL